MLKKYKLLRRILKYRKRKQLKNNSKIINNQNQFQSRTKNNKNLSIRLKKIKQNKVKFRYIVLIIKTLNKIYLKKNKKEIKLQFLTNKYNIFQMYKVQENLKKCLNLL